MVSVNVEESGLTFRTMIASCLLAVIIGATFAVLLSSVAELRQLEHRAQQSEDVLVAANRLERLVVDLETGQRGFLLTGSEQFLQPWLQARAAFPQQATALENLVAGTAEQHARAERLAQAGNSYLKDYSVPLIAAAQKNRSSVNVLAATEEGKQRTDAMRTQFDQMLSAEGQLTTARQDRVDDVAHRAIVAAAGSCRLRCSYGRPRRWCRPTSRRYAPNSPTPHRSSPSRSTNCASCPGASTPRS